VDKYHLHFFRIDGTRVVVRTLDGTEHVVETRMDNPFSRVAMSADGATLAVIGIPRKKTLFGWKPGRPEEQQLQLFGIASNEMRHLGGPLALNAKWFPDGRRIVYQDHTRQFVARTDGGASKMICAVPSTTGFESLTVSPGGAYTAALRSKGGAKHLVLHSIATGETTATEFRCWGYGWLDEETIVFTKSTSRGDKIWSYAIPSGKETLICQALSDSSIAPGTSADAPVRAMVRADSAWDKKQYSRIRTCAGRIFFVSHAYFENAHYYGVMSIARDGADLCCHHLEISRDEPNGEVRMISDVIPFNEGRTVCVCSDFIVDGTRIRSEWSYHGERATEIPAGYMPLVDHSTPSVTAIMPWTEMPKLKARPVLRT